MSLIPKLYRQLTDVSAAVGIGDGLSRLKSAVVAAGGSGYQIGEVLSLSGGTNLLTANARVQVQEIAPGGVVTRVALFLDYGGAYTVKPSVPVATVSGGLGTGCTVTPTWEDEAAPYGCTMAIVQVEAQAVRWRDDGTDPTDSVGTSVAAGDSFVYTGKLSALKVIESTSGAILNVTFYR